MLSARKGGDRSQGTNTTTQNSIRDALDVEPWVREGGMGRRSMSQADKGLGTGKGHGSEEEGTEQGSGEAPHPACPTLPWLVSVPRPQREMSGHQRWGRSGEPVCSTASGDSANAGADPVLPGDSPGPQLPRAPICQ